MIGFLTFLKRYPVSSLLNPFSFFLSDTDKIVASLRIHNTTRSQQKTRNPQSLWQRLRNHDYTREARYDWRQRLQVQNSSICGPSCLCSMLHNLHLTYTPSTLNCYRTYSSPKEHPGAIISINTSTTQISWPNVMACFRNTWLNTTLDAKIKLSR